MVVILLLLAVWGGVGVWWFLSRPDSHSSDSIGTFRHQLRVLERTGPTTVDPAFRMEADGLGVHGASRTATLTRSSRPVLSAAAVAGARRRQVQKRRREVFYGLLAAVGGAVVLGFLPGLSVMWWLAALLTGVLALYVIVLIQLRASALERLEKVRYLPDPQEAAVGAGDPAYVLRRSAN